MKFTYSVILNLKHLPTASDILNHHKVNVFKNVLKSFLTMKVGEFIWQGKARQGKARQGKANTTSKEQSDSSLKLIYW